jgi:hypothetical protein
MSRASLVIACAACARKSPLVVEQRIETGQLAWFESFSCPCGHAFSAQGQGLPSPVIRGRILKQNGEAELWIHEVPKGREPLVARTIQKALDASHSIEPRLHALPTAVYSGSATEVAFLQSVLAQIQVESKTLQHLPTVLDE